MMRSFRFVVSLGDLPGISHGDGWQGGDCVPLPGQRFQAVGHISRIRFRAGKDDERPLLSGRNSQSDSHQFRQLL